MYQQLFSHGDEQTSTLNSFKMTVRFLAAALVFGVSGEILAQPAGHVGKVYDIDYIRNTDGAQILIRQDFVGHSEHPFIIRGAETAMQSGIEVWVLADNQHPRHIERLRIEQVVPIPPVPVGLHYVQDVDIEARWNVVTTVLIDDRGNPVTCKTSDARVASLLLTAFREKWFLGYVSIDPATGEITRAKINIEDQP